MTREQAIAELSELEPREAEAWKRYEARVQERDKAYAALKTRLDQIYPEAAAELTLLDAVWGPMYRRKVQLKAYLEISG